MGFEGNEWRQMGRQRWLGEDEGWVDGGGSTEFPENKGWVSKGRGQRMGR